MILADLLSLFLLCDVEYLTMPTNYSIFMLNALGD
ncbi:hypothetical protein BMS3Bbin04_00095 [bacterium BMS3Bbin04]|nr:hypothetical protein BMS3Bbin04_00095 [bacterium BMS3Bbin04]